MAPSHHSVLLQYQRQSLILHPEVSVTLYHVILFYLPYSMLYNHLILLLTISHLLAVSARTLSAWLTPFPGTCLHRIPQCLAAGWWVILAWSNAAGPT